LWVSQIDEPTEIKVGIEVIESRLSVDEGMIERETIKNHPVLCKNRIITNPIGTVFRLNSEETNFIFGLWRVSFIGENSSIYTAIEGASELRTHFRRERSQKLIAQKKEQYKKLHKILRCEICGLSFEETYPKPLGENFIEAHHKAPLSKTNQVVKTTLDDLMNLSRLFSF